MKVIKIILMFATCSFLIFTGCKDDSSTTGPTQQQEVNKVTFNGGGYSNVSVFPYFTFAAYLSSLSVTGVQLKYTINTDTLNLLIYFPGQATGTYQWVTADNFVVLFISPAGKEYRNKVNSGTTNVTAYGSTGQKIEGNFEGAVINKSSPYDTIQVKSSFFSVVRSLQ
jgi:hypothetical protein